MYIEQLFSVSNKTIVITGAGSGLGQHCVELFSKLGSNVAYIDINLNGLNETESKISQYKNKTLKIQTDVTDETAVKNAIDKIINTFNKIDVLINCAAIIDYVPMMKVTREIWDKTYNVDLLGTWFMCKAVAATMIEKKVAGSIINLASSLCHRTQIDLIPYNSIKAAIAHMTRSMGLELVDHHIRVNALAPGFIKTKMVEDFLKTDDGKKSLNNVPFKRAANLSEIEGIILLLASDASSYMSGSVIMIDGGLAFNGIPIAKS